MSWLVEVETEVQGNHEAPEAKRFYSRVVSELIKLDVFDVDFHGELRNGPVWFAATVRDSELLDAAAHGLTAIRTAIHAAGGSTRGWPSVNDLQIEEDGDGKWVCTFSGSSQKLLESVPA